MNRRTFLQLSGMTAAGALLAGCKSANEKLIPYLIPPDEGVTPGIANYYASSCRSCPAGCGILVRVSEGRAKKDRGEPRCIRSTGENCAPGDRPFSRSFTIPTAYRSRSSAPGRAVRENSRRSPGKRGWTCSSDKLKSLQQEKAADRLALLTPELRGTLAKLTARFMRSFGSPHHLSYELLGPDWLRAGQPPKLRSGEPSLITTWLRPAICSASAPISWKAILSPVQYGYAFGRMRQGTGHGPRSFHLRRRPDVPDRCLGRSLDAGPAGKRRDAGPRHGPADPG